jgi:hypothetical protein
VSCNQACLSISLSLSHTLFLSDKLESGSSLVSINLFSLSVSWTHISISFCSQSFCFCDFSKHGSAHPFSLGRTRGLSWWHLGG